MTPAVWVGDDCCLCFACTWVLRALTLTHVNFKWQFQIQTRQSRAHARAAGQRIIAIDWFNGIPSVFDPIASSTSNVSWSTRVSSQAHVRNHCSRRQRNLPARALPWLLALALAVLVPLLGVDVHQGSHGLV